MTKLARKRKLTFFHNVTLPVNRSHVYVSEMWRNNDLFNSTTMKLYRSARSHKKVQRSHNHIDMRNIERKVRLKINIEIRIEYVKSNLKP